MVLSVGKVTYSDKVPGGKVNSKFGLSKISAADSVIVFEFSRPQYSAKIRKVAWKHQENCTAGLLLIYGNVKFVDSKIIFQT